MNIKITESNGKKVYFVNDVRYENLSDIPAEFKKYFADKDNNGVPDQFDKLRIMSEMFKEGKTSGLKELFKSLGDDNNIQDSGTSTSINDLPSFEEQPRKWPLMVKVMIVLTVLFVVAALLVPKLIK